MTGEDPDAFEEGRGRVGEDFEDETGRARPDRELPGRDLRVRDREPAGRGPPDDEELAPDRGAPTRVGPGRHLEDPRGTAEGPALLPTARALAPRPAHEALPGCRPDQGPRTGRGPEATTVPRCLCW